MFYLLLTFAYLAFLVLPQSVPELPIGQTNTFKILIFNATEVDSGISGWADTAYEAAVIAAYNFNKNGGIHGRMIELVKRVVVRNNYQKAISDYLAEPGSSRPLAVFGFATGIGLLRSNEILEANDIPSFGHNIALANLPVNHINVFSHGGAYLQLLATMEELILVRKLRRVAVMNVAGDDAAKKQVDLDILLRGYGLSVIDTFEPYIGSNPERIWSEEVYKQKWDKFVSTNPQAVLMGSRSSSYNYRFVQEALTKLTIDRTITLVFSHELSIITTAAVTDLLKNSPEVLPRLKENATLLYALANPAAYMPFPVLKTFYSEYQAAHEALKGTPYGLALAPTAFKKRSLHSDIKLTHTAGNWLSFQLLIEALRGASATYNTLDFNSSQLRSSIFSQRIFSPGGHSGAYTTLTYGIYYEVCPLKTPYCICNQGGHDIFISAYNWSSERLTTVIQRRSHLSVCLTIDMVMPLLIILYRPTARVGTSSMDRIDDLLLLEDLFRKRGAQIPILTFTKPTSYEGVTGVQSRSYRELLAVQENNFASIIGGTQVRMPMLPRLKMALIEPIAQITYPFMWTKFARNIIRVNAVLELELNALAGFIEKKFNGVNLKSSERQVAKFEDIIDAPVYLLLFDSLDDDEPVFGQGKADRLAKFFKMVLSTHLIPFQEMLYQAPGASINALLEHSFRKNAFVMLIGLPDDIVMFVQSLLTRNPSLTVLLSFDDVMRSYSHFKEKTLSTDHLERILFATSLPHWLPPFGNRASKEHLEELPGVDRTTGTTTVDSEAAQSFYDLTISHPKLRRPFYFMNYIVMRFLQEVASKIKTPPYKRKPGEAPFVLQATSDALLNTIYEQRYVTIDNILSFGPFYDKLCDNPEIINENTTIDQIWSDPERNKKKLVNDDPCERNWARSRM